MLQQNDSSTTDFTLEDLSLISGTALKAARCAYYLVIALLLLVLNKYGLGLRDWPIALCICALGVGSLSARLGITAIGALLAMVIFPPETLQAIAASF
jgi:hypothetical protein